VTTCLSLYGGFCRERSPGVPEPNTAMTISPLGQRGCELRPLVEPAADARVMPACALRLLAESSSGAAVISADLRRLLSSP
jgi:hypothetical protein